MSPVPASRWTFGVQGSAGASQVDLLQQQNETATHKLTYGRATQVGQPILEQAQVGSVTACPENDPVTG